MAGNENISGFLNEATEIEEKITTAKTNIKKIQEYQSQILNSTSTTQEDFTSKEREKLISDTRNLLVECKNRIKQIQYDNARISSTTSSFGIRTQRYEYLRTKLSNVLEEYRQAEGDFMNESKNRMARQYEIVNPNATQEDIDDYLSNPDSQPIFQQALLRTNEAKNALAEVQKRHGDIKKIENTIAELANLFQELHLQVEEQSQTIVNIEHNAEVVAEKTEEVTQELGTATRLAGAARKKKWICFGITLLIIIIIVVVLVVHFMSNNNGNSNNNNSNNNINKNNNNSNSSSFKPTSTTKTIATALQ